MKKVFALIAVASMIALASCNSNKPAEEVIVEEAPATEVVEEVAPAAEEAAPVAEEAAAPAQN